MTDFKEIEAEVRRIAQESPQFAYERHTGVRWCMYIFNGEGDCIFGRALINVGVPLEELACCESQPIAGVLRDLNIPTTPRERDWAGAVQEWQDKGAAWGEAVTYADERYPLGGLA